MKYQKVIQIKISDLERVFGKLVKRNHKVLAFDTASRTGWTKITTTDKVAKFDFGFIDIKSTGDKRFNDFIDIINHIIVDVDSVIMEDTYMRFNVKVFKLLTRLGAFIYCLCELKCLKDKTFITPSASRSYLGLDSKAKKEDVHIHFHKLLPRFDKVVDVDIIDSIILALNGILEDPKMEV